MNPYLYLETGFITSDALLAEITTPLPSVHPAEL